ncbi:hypothetical protein [Mycobacterium talmoniae]|uniref:Uncharacterized protein n=1 Tax=Mycobacterium talmoniae TaxID=1858794 RepID=A0A1S1NN31_9MYCO|nr:MULTISPECIES: hypothetical protein [Mycobacterium]OHV04669.1 hypothetical protein BKN37_08855 [Mycobacterium talmoniae]PQM45294.1 hypothetical protein C1Y40_04551 [Mycobacterium talmoniae]TDH49300.1 hypothetical protein E2F47_21045 [Mycobacterium eburneum]
MTNQGQDPRVLVEQVVRALTQEAPAGWNKLRGVFSMAGGEEITRAVALTAEQTFSIPIQSRIVEPIRLHRQITAVGPDGPWLRLLFEYDSAGGLRVGFDYGGAELPADQLLSGEAYRRDIERYPRPNVPLWLLAHMANDGRQLRSAADARITAAAGVDVLVADNDLPPLSLLWARIAVLAAVSRGSDASVGSRTDPSFQEYIGDTGGCILARLPGDRGVFSGGRDNSRLLSAAYRGLIGWPDLYRGAPSWLHNLYLHPRAAAGRLSFCYWWDDGHWYRAELPEAGVLASEDPPWNRTEELAGGAPGVRTTASTAELVAKTLEHIVRPDERNSASVLRLIEAAEAGTASEQNLAELFVSGVPAAFDMAEALAQLDAADVLLRTYPHR